MFGRYVPLYRPFQVPRLHWNSIAKMQLVSHGALIFTFIQFHSFSERQPASSYEMYLRRQENGIESDPARSIRMSHLCSLASMSYGFNSSTCLVGIR